MAWKSRTPVCFTGSVDGAGTLLQYLRDGVPRTRSELAAVTGLGRSTIAQRVDALMASSLVGAAGEATSSGGRPPTQFAFNPSARVILAADVGATHVRLAVTDLAANVLASELVDLDIALGPEAVLRWLLDHGRTLLTKADRSVDDVAGVGIGLPGPVEHATGRPTNPPIMPGWDGFDVPGFVNAEAPDFDCVVTVDNDVNVMALGEHFLGFHDVAHLMFVKVATGIGSGIISDGALRRGAQGAAGDLGHIHVPHDVDAVCRCGNVGCLEAVASGAAVASQLRAAGLEAYASRDVAALVRGGSVLATQLVREAGRTIGEVLASAVSLLNPSVIVIGGSLSAAGDPLLAGVREVVYRRSLPLATAELRIVPASAGDLSGVVGAAVMVIDDVLSPDAVDRYVG
jgi:predicted NBD/HSP70 family sugar kinase